MYPSIPHILRCPSAVRIAALALLLLAVAVLLAPARPAEADGNGPLECSTNHTKGGTAEASIDPGDDSEAGFEFEYGAPEGLTVTGVCIKTGGGLGGQQYFPPRGHSSLVTADTTLGDGCYEVTFLSTTTIRVARQVTSNAGAACKQIGHLDFDLSSDGEPPSPSGDELTDGNTLLLLDGVAVGAVQGTLDAPVTVSVTEAAAPNLVLPGGALPHGKYYILRASRDVYAPEDGSFILGLPVPSGTPTTNLGIAELAPTDVAGEFAWLPYTGVFDEDTQLLLVAMPSLPSQEHILVLMEQRDILSPLNPPAADTVMPAAVTAQATGEFRVLCLLENVVAWSFCREVDALIIERTMEGTSTTQGFYDEFKAMGYPEPRLERGTIEVRLFPPYVGSGNQYIIIREDETDPNCVKESTEDPGDLEGLEGKYVIPSKKLFICHSIPTTGMPKGSKPYQVLRHEYFHALQYGFPAGMASFENGTTSDWIVEATAAAAQESDATSMKRSRLFVLDKVDESLHFGKYTPQDFWSFFGRAEGLDILVPLFEEGLGTLDLIRWMGTEDLKDAYWEYAKNQAMAEVDLLNDSLTAHCAYQSFTTETPRHFIPTDVEDTVSSLIGPMSAHALDVETLALDLEEGTPITYSVTSDLGDDPDLRFKVYVEGEQPCDSSVPDGPRTLPFQPIGPTIYVVVGNPTLVDVKTYIVSLTVEPAED